MEDGKRPTVGNFGRYRFFDLEILFYPAVRFFGEPFFLADFECCLAVIFFFFLQNDRSQLSEYFFDVPIRRIVTAVFLAVEKHPIKIR